MPRIFQCFKTSQFHSEKNIYAFATCIFLGMRTHNTHTHKEKYGAV